MQIIKRYRLEILALGLITLIYLLLRLLTLGNLPIFTDEAIYTRWSQIAKNDASWRFISLTDGKQPMFVWISMIVMRFVQDPLLATRTVSVFAGLTSLFGLFLLSYELFKSKWVGILSAFLYLIFPMALVYDRMALYDSLVGSFSVWSLYLVVLFSKRIRLDLALLMALVMGGGMLTKTSGFFSATFLPMGLILFDWKRGVKNKLLKWVIYSVLAVCLSYLYYSILRLSPFFHIIDEKNAIFVYPFKEWLTHPFFYFFGNLRVLFEWLIVYLTPPIFILVLASIYVGRKYLPEIVFLLLAFLVPFVYLALFGRTIYPRFIFFMALSLVPLASLALCCLYDLVRHKILYFILFFLFILAPLRSSFQVVTDFPVSPIPMADLSQYYFDWPAGIGVKEAVAYLKQEADKHKIFVATAGTFGLMPYSLEIYLVDNPNVKIISFWPVKEKIPKEIESASRTLPTYVLFYQPCPLCKEDGLAPDSWPVSKVLQVPRDDGFLSLYKVNR